MEEGSEGKNTKMNVNEEDRKGQRVERLQAEDGEPLPEQENKSEKRKNFPLKEKRRKEDKEN